MGHTRPMPDRGSFVLRSFRPFGALGLALGLLAAPACSKKDAGTSTPLEAAPPALAATEAADVAMLCSGEERRRWELVDDAGAVLATTQGVCRPADPEDPAPYVAISQLSSEGVPRYEYRLWLDPQGRPVEAQLREPSSTRYYSWSEATLIETHLGDVRTQTADEDDPLTWVVPSHALFVRELMLRLGVGQRGELLEQRSYAPDRDRISQLELRPVRAGDAAELALGAGKFELHGNTRLAELRVSGFVDDGGRQVYRGVEAPAALEELLPEVPRPSYRLAADLEVRAVDIPALGEAPKLGAELVLAADGGTAARPGVLFLSGTGPQDRLGFVAGGALDVGSHEIHDGLARAGFAVLRFDERGVGESEIGEDPTPGFDASVEDARRALAALAARPEVDAQRIVVIGHGEGALVASMLGQGSQRLGKKKIKAKVRALVLLAAPGRNIRELVYDEIRRSLIGRDPTTVEAAVGEARRVHEAALADKELPASAEPLREWMQEVFVIDPAAELRKVTVPVYALHGDKDFQVHPVRDFELVALALREGKSGKASKAERRPGLDHLFKPEAGESHAGHYRDLSRHVDPAVVQDIATWLGAVLAGS